MMANDDGSARVGAVLPDETAMMNDNLETQMRIDWLTEKNKCPYSCD